MPTTRRAPWLIAAILLAGGLAACAETQAASYGGQPATATAALAPAGQGSSAARELAARRLEAIARGDTEFVLRGYGEDAVLHWVGGPLDGTYRGQEQIATVWRRFAAAQGPMRVTLGAAVEGVNPRGARVVTPVAFAGERGAVKVRHVVVVRDGRVVNETWQVDPALPL